MTVVLDANILLRLTDRAAPLHTVTVTAVRALATRGDTLVTVPQSHYEFWVAATRPLANNGLGLPVADCQLEADQLLVRFPALPEAATQFAEWRALVVAHACVGKVAHDARYIAAMRSHGVTHLLTFNTADFARFPGVTILDPIALATPPPVSTGS